MEENKSGIQNRTAEIQTKRAGRFLQRKYFISRTRGFLLRNRELALRLKNMAYVCNLHSSHHDVDEACMQIPDRKYADKMQQCNEICIGHENECILLYLSSVSESSWT